jgi:putative flippase GtrA
VISAPYSAPSSSSASPSRFWQWVRHNTTAIVATAVDYIVMIALVEAAGLGPVPATAVAALAGALTSFSMGRRFTYRAIHVPASSQAWRYALVSAASLGLNTAGEYLFFEVIGLQYLVARVVTSIIVSNGWNYPMQRFFVFSAGSTPRA